MLAFLLAIGVWSSENQLDINQAGLAEIRQLPVDSVTAVKIFEHLERYGRFNSIYELLRIPGITPEKLDELKPLIYIRPRTWDERRQENIQRIQRRLATEDGPSRVVVEEWQDRLLDPINVNRAGVDELLILENVSLVDAVSVVRFVRRGGKISSRRDLASKVDGLSTYGYRGMRSYVKFDDQPGDPFGGNYRFRYETVEPTRDFIEPSDFNSALKKLDQDSVKFREAGYTEEERRFFNEQLLREKEWREKMGRISEVRHRLRLRIGEHFRIAGWLGQHPSDYRLVDDFKGYITLERVGQLRRLILGDLRLTLGQGLLMDNNFELLPRVYNRTNGLFGDISDNPGFGLRGGAVDLGVWRLGILGFFSRAKRDGIINPDSTVNWYIITTPRYPTVKNVFHQTDAGGSFQFDLSEIGFIPLGTKFSLNGLYSRSSRRFNPDPKYLDLPGDNEVLDDPGYLRLDTGYIRMFYSVDFRTVIENFSVEGEFAQQFKSGRAYLIKARTQYDYLYLTALYRHYDVNYNNPYNRGYCEELRFDDTPLEKPYRLIDPLYSALARFPMPKAERGFLLEMRYQISRQITFTRVYLDLWQNLVSGADNYRFQGEIEYRPVFPLRLRFRQKVQFKEKPRLVIGTRSLSLESSIRALLSLSNWDYLTGEVRTSKTLLTSSMNYGDKVGINSDFVAVQWEHNFSEDFQSELGLVTWRSGGMSNWLFEDTGIDFIEGDGFKWYLALSDRLTDNLLVYVKFRNKLSLFPRTGLANNEQLHYADGGAVRDFIYRNSRFDISFQLDFLW